MNKQNTKLDQSLRSKRIKRHFEKYMYFLAVAGNLGFYIQAATIFYNKNSENISLTAFSFFILVQFSWVLYGRMRGDKQLALANLIAMFGSILIVIGVLLYN